MENAINHCGMQSAIQRKQMSKADIQEAVMERSSQIVTNTLAGKSTKPHDLDGIELLAFVVAQHVLTEGALKLAGDFDIDLETMKTQAASTHISYC